MRRPIGVPDNVSVRVNHDVVFRAPVVLRSPAPMALADAASASTPQQQYATHDQYVSESGPGPEAALAGLALAITRTTMNSSMAESAEALAVRMIAAPPTPDRDVLEATYGLRVMAAASDLKDQYAVGNAVLSELGAQATNPRVATFAKAVMATGGLAGLDRRSAAAFQWQGLHLIESGVGRGTVEKALGALGKQINAVGYGHDDQCRMGRAVIDEIRLVSTDPQVDALVRYYDATCATAGVTQAQIVLAHDTVFNRIVSGAAAVPPLPGSPGLDGRIVLPVIDEKADPETRRAELEDCITRNKKTIRLFEAGQGEASRKAAEAQNREMELLGKVDTLQPILTPYLRRKERLQVLAGISLVAAGFAFFSTVATGPSVAMGVLAAEGVGMMLGRLGISRTDREIFSLHRRIQKLTSEATALHMQASANGSRAAYFDRAQGQAEAIVKDAQGKLDVLRMAFPAADPARPDAPVTTEEAFVLVGGLKVPRNTAARPVEPEAPHVEPDIEGIALKDGHQ